MGAYTDMVANTFAGAKQALNTQIGEEKNAGTAKTSQANLAGGITGPAATALISRNTRQIGNNATTGLLNLGTQERQQMYDAFQKEQALNLQSDTANRTMWMQGLQGAGSLLGGIASLNPGGILNGVKQIAGAVPTGEKQIAGAAPTGTGGMNSTTVGKQNPDNYENYYMYNDPSKTAGQLYGFNLNNGYGSQYR
jgi:hypothetical protein